MVEIIRVHAIFSPKKLHDVLFGNEFQAIEGIQHRRAFLAGGALLGFLHLSVIYKTLLDEQINNEIINV